MNIFLQQTFNCIDYIRIAQYIAPKNIPVSILVDEITKFHKTKISAIVMSFTLFFSNSLLI